MVKKTRVTLSNGLPLVIVEIPDSKSLVTSFWTKAGSRFDPNGKAGMAHFLEHLLIKKTKSYPTDIELAQVLENVGAFKNGTTNKDWMNLNITSSSKDLELTMRILSDMVLNPLIDQKGFETERRVIFQEQARQQSIPDNLVWEVWFKTFFSPSLMMNPVLGDERSLQNIKLEESVKFWAEKAKMRSNILLISGGINANDVTNLAEKYFAGTKLNEIETPRFSYKAKERMIIEKRDLPRTNMLLSFKTPGGPIYKDFYPLQVLRGILAAGWSSRIQQRLRVKESLIYGFGARIIRYFDIGAFTLIGASDKHNFPKMFQILCEELVKLREKGVSQNELNLAKGFLGGSTLSGIETSWDYANWYALDELYWPDKVESPEQRIKRINRVKLEEVESVAKKYLKEDSWNLAVLGNVQKSEVKVEL